MRPLYVLCVVWGAKYRSYFSNYCLRSLLAPGNLGSLSASDGHKLLICTTSADWQALADLPIMTAMSRHVTPQLLEIGMPGDLPDPSTAKFRHMSLGHRLLTEAAHRDGALATLIAPDAVFSDGTIAAALRLAEKGAHAVLAFTPRMIEEGLLGELRELGLLTPAEASESSPLTLDGRAVVGPAIRNLEPDNLASYWTGRGFPKWPAFCIWPSVDQTGILIHSFYHWYVLLDFSAVSQHQTRAFDTASIENSWLSDNFPDPARVHVLQDSNESVVLSWAPGLSTNSDRNAAVRGLSLFTALRRGFRLRCAREFHVLLGDFQKANTIRFPIRWHVGNTDSGWKEAESQARRTMMWFFGDVFEEFTKEQPRSALIFLQAWWLVLRLASGFRVRAYMFAIALRRKLKRAVVRSF